MLSDFHLFLGQTHPQQMRYNGWGAMSAFLMDEINHDGWIWSPWRKLKLRSSVKKCINYCWSDIVVGEQVMRIENIFFVHNRWCYDGKILIKYCLSYHQRGSGFWFYFLQIKCLPKVNWRAKTTQKKKCLSTLRKKLATL